MPKDTTIHKAFKIVTVTDTKGNVSQVRSTYSKETMKLEVDTNTHPAWTNQKGYVDENAGGVASFNKRYAGMNFLGGAAVASEEKSSDNANA